MQPLEHILAIAERVAASRGLTIWLIQSRRELSGNVVRVFIDRPGPAATPEESVRIEDCEQFNREISKSLVVEDPLRFAYSLEDIGAYYRDYVELMAHFDAVLPGRVHRVFHEALVEDTEAQVRALLDYCGLPFEDACLRSHESSRAVSTPSAAQVRQVISAGGIGHWRRYEPFLGEILEALAEEDDRGATD